MLANVSRVLLLLLFLAPVLVSAQIETQDVDRTELYECVVGNVAASSKRTAAAPQEVPSVVPAAMVQATTAALQTAGVKVNNITFILYMFISVRQRCHSGRVTEVCQKMRPIEEPPACAGLPSPVV
jgi:hypothetical protein